MNKTNATQGPNFQVVITGLDFRKIRLNLNESLSFLQVRLGRLRPKCLASRRELHHVTTFGAGKRQSQSEIQQGIGNKNALLCPSRCRFRTSHWERESAQVQAKRQVSHIGIDGLRWTWLSVRLNWRRTRLSDSAKQEAHADCDEQSTSKSGRDQDKMSPGPQGYAKPRRLGCLLLRL